MATPEPESTKLLDRRRLREEYGLSPAAADAVFRELPTVSIPGLRRCYIKREDLDRAIERWTWVEPDLGPVIRRRSPLRPGGPLDGARF